MLLAVLVHALVQHRLNMAQLLLDGLKIHRQVLQANLPSMAYFGHLFTFIWSNVFLVLFWQVMMNILVQIETRNMTKREATIDCVNNSGHGVMTS